MKDYEIRFKSEDLKLMIHQAELRHGRDSDLAVQLREELRSFELLLANVEEREQR
jgi:hypothetical protein